MIKGADNCAAFDALLLDYAYGEVEGTTRLELEAHLEGCVACRSSLDAIGATRRVMQALEPEPAPVDGLESLLDYARRAAVRTAAPRRNPWLWLVPAMSAGSLGLVLALVLSKDREPRESVLPALPAAVSPAWPAPFEPVEQAIVPAASAQGAAGEGSPLSTSAIAAKEEEAKAVGRAAGALGGKMSHPEKKEWTPRIKAKSQAVLSPKPSASTADMGHFVDEDAAGDKRSPPGSDFGGPLAESAPPAASASDAHGQMPAIPAPPRRESEQARSADRQMRDEPVGGLDDVQPEVALKPQPATRAAARASSADAEALPSEFAGGIDAAITNARIASERGDFQQATAILSSAISADPNDRRSADALWALAEAYERAGEVARAEATYLQFLEFFPSDGRARLAGAKSAWLRKRVGSASKASDEASPTGAGGLPAAAPAQPAAPGSASPKQGEVSPGR